MLNGDKDWGIDQWEWFWYQLYRSFQKVVFFFFGHRPCPRFPLMRVQEHTRIYDYWINGMRTRGHRKGLIYSYWSGPIWTGITQMHSWSCTKVVKPTVSLSLLIKPYIGGAFLPWQHFRTLCNDHSSWNIETTAEAPGIAWGPSSRILAYKLAISTTWISIRVFRCGLSRIDMIVLFPSYKCQTLRDAFLQISVMYCHTCSHARCMTWHFAD